MPQGNDWDSYDSTNTMVLDHSTGKLRKQTSQEAAQNVVAKEALDSVKKEMDDNTQKNIADERRKRSNPLSIFRTTRVRLPEDK